MTDPARRPVIVAVDDEQPVLSSLRRLLRREPYDLLTTDDPLVAISWILDQQASVVIADQRMPSITGLAFLELTRACSPQTARVMLTGQSDLTGILKLRQIDAIQRLVRKPWDDDVLKRILIQLVTTGERLQALETGKKA